MSTNRETSLGNFDHLFDEIRQMIFSYCSPEMLAVLATVSHQVELESAFYRLLDAVVHSRHSTPTPEAFAASAALRKRYPFMMFDYEVSIIDDHGCALRGTPHRFLWGTGDKWTLISATLEKHPELLFRQGVVFDGYGRKLRGSPYQLLWGAGDIWALIEVHLSTLPKIANGEEIAKTQFKAQFPNCPWPLKPGMKEEVLYDERNKILTRAVIKQLDEVVNLLILDPCTDKKPTRVETTNAITELFNIIKPIEGEIIETGLHFPISILDAVCKRSERLFGVNHQNAYSVYYNEVANPIAKALTLVNIQFFLTLKKDSRSNDVTLEYKSDPDRSIKIPEMVWYYSRSNNYTFLMQARSKEIWGVWKDAILEVHQFYMKLSEKISEAFEDLEQNKYSFPVYLTAYTNLKELRRITTYYLNSPCESISAVMRLDACFKFVNSSIYDKDYAVLKKFNSPLHKVYQFLYREFLDFGYTLPYDRIGVSVKSVNNYVETEKNRETLREIGSGTYSLFDTLSKLPSKKWQDCLDYLGYQDLIERLTANVVRKSGTSLTLALAELPFALEYVFSPTTVRQFMQSNACIVPLKASARLEEYINLLRAHWLTSITGLAKVDLSKENDHHKKLFIYCAYVAYWQYRDLMPEHASYLGKMWGAPSKDSKKAAVDCMLKTLISSDSLADVVRKLDDPKEELSIHKSALENSHLGIITKLLRRNASNEFEADPTPKTYPWVPFVSN